MTPEAMTRLVHRWVRLYTRGLPTAIARRRQDEIHADLHDHIAHQRGGGTSDRRIAVAVASRWVRGVAADTAWRGHTRSKEGMTMSSPLLRSIRRVTLVTALILLVPLVLNQVTSGSSWSAFDFVLAAVLLVAGGLLLEAVLRQPRNRVVQVVAIVIGAAAMAVGQADDAPGLGGFGLLLIAGTIGLALRTRHRSA